MDQKFREEIILPLFFRILGRSRMNNFRKLKNHNNCSSDSIEELTLQKLKTLIHYVYETTPYYKKLLDKNGISPEDIDDFSDFEEIPLLTKKIIRTNIEDIISRQYPLSHLMSITTGGSTGIPLRFFHTKDEEELQRAVWLRNHLWSGMSPGDPYFMIWGAPQDFISRWHPNYWINNLVQNRKILDAFVIRNPRKTFTKWLKLFSRKKGRFFYGYGSIIQEFAKFLDEKGIELSGMKGVISSAEPIRERELISRTFGCQVFDQYGSREFLSTAQECNNGKMHIASDVVHLEAIPIPNSEYCKIILTFLDQFSMPFIRYEIGDMAKIGITKCSCDLPFPTFNLSIGRITDLIIRPDGGFISASALSVILSKLLGQGIAQYQIIQEEPAEFTIEYIPADQNKVELDLKLIEKTLIRLCDNDTIRLKAKEVVQIQKTPTGKEKQFISKIAVEST